VAPHFQQGGVGKKGTATLEKRNGLLAQQGSVLGRGPINGGGREPSEPSITSKAKRRDSLHLRGKKKEPIHLEKREKETVLW